MRPQVHYDANGRAHRHKVVAGTGCGKLGYSSRKIAASAAANSRRTTGEDIRPYKCPHGCHCWHIGHHPWWAK